MRAISLSLVAAFVVSSLGCASAPRRGTPAKDLVTIDSPQLARGQQVYMTHCQPCHPGAQAGVGPSLKKLPDYLIRFQVRQGLGVMPSFGPDVISDPELDDLVAFVRALVTEPPQ